MAAKDDKGRVEQIIGECFVKVANIILSSRIHHGSQSPTEDKAPKKCWFNLKVDELPSAQELVLQWRRSITQPMFLEIYQLPDAAAEREDQAEASADFTARPDDSEAGTLLEVWAIQWQQDKRPAKPQSSRLEPAAIYKRLVIMLRSLFAYVRVLPAFKLYRARKRDSACASAMRYRLIKGPGNAFSPEVAGQLQHFNFTPIETPFGTFTIGVEHRPSSSIKVRQTAPLAAPNPHIIPDYIGGQKLRSTLSADLSSQRSSLIPRGPGEAGRASPMQQPPPLLRRHSWSLASARGQSIPEAESSNTTAGISESRMSQAGPSDSLLYQGRRDRGPSPSAFAPNTPKAAATPPKYPAGGLAARMARLASGTGRGMSPSGRSGSGRASPARPEQGQELRTFKPAALAATVARKAPEPEASAAGPSRPSSQPVLIPGCEKGQRRLRSSGDLLGMNDAAECPQTTARRGPAPADAKPASAPAASTYIGFQLRDGVDSKRPQKPVEAAVRSTLGSDLLKQPDTPPVLQPLPSLGSESSCSMASSFLASGSPQLPFALTPTTNSYISAAEPQRRADVGPLVLQPSRKESVPAAAGLSLGSEPAPGAVGYSVSPMLDSLGSSLFSSSTPLAAAQLPFSLPSATSSPLPTPKGNSSGGAQACPVEVLMASSDTEADSLPFALDGEAPVTSPSATREPVAASGTRSLGLQGEPDAAVGAFVRLIQDAPPLRKPEQPPGTPPSHAQELSLAAGLEQLSRLRLRINQLAPPPSQS